MRGWGANESLRRGPPEYAPALKMVFVHHTDTASVYPCSDSARIVRGIYAYHVLTNGWNDIGYNFLIDRYGHVFEGRYGGVTRPVVGAHARGFNTGSSGIAMIGTFTSTAAHPGRSAVASGADRMAARPRSRRSHLKGADDDRDRQRAVPARYPAVVAGRLRAPRYRRHVLSGRRALPPAAPDRSFGAAHRPTQDLQPRVKGSLKRLGQDGVAPIRFRATLSRPPTGR